MGHQPRVVRQEIGIRAENLRGLPHNTMQSAIEKGVLLQNTRDAPCPHAAGHTATVERRFGIRRPGRYSPGAKVLG